MEIRRDQQRRVHPYRRPPRVAERVGRTEDRHLVDDGVEVERNVHAEHRREPDRRSSGGAEQDAER